MTRVVGVTIYRFTARLCWKRGHFPGDSGGWLWNRLTVFLLLIVIPEVTLIKIFSCNILREYLICQLCEVGFSIHTGSVLLALGSEDTSVTLLSATPHSRPVVLTTLTGHLSSVRALSSSPCPNGLLLFSGGARASLKAWSIPLGELKLSRY